jgi:hypothetical protein
MATYTIWHDSLHDDYTLAEGCDPPEVVGGRSPPHVNPVILFDAADPATAYRRYANWCGPTRATALLVLLDDRPPAAAPSGGTATPAPSATAGPR